MKKTLLRTISLLLCCAMLCSFLPLQLIPTAAAADEYVTVQIDYCYSDGAEAFSPYIARLIKGTAFETVVQSPDIIGFSPVIYSGEIETPAEQVSLSFTAEQMDENQSIKVTYLPKEVPYQVQHFLQSVDSDDYRQDATVSNADKAGCLPPAAELEKEYPGFTILPYDPSRIAADGSTVFQMYYDRNYYIVSFDLSGGHGVEPIYGRYGSSFRVGEPMRTGYTFAGWDIADESGFDGKADRMYSTIPARNLKCRALWTPNDSSYTVVYWKQNANADGYSYWCSKTVTAHSDDRVSGKDDLSRTDTAAVLYSNGFNTYEKDYFHYNAERTDRDVSVAGDGTTVVNVYYDRNVYDLRFYIGKKNRSTGETFISDNTSRGVYTDVFRCSISPSAEDWNAYTAGALTEELDGFDYYYFDLKDLKYGQKISDIWPANGPISKVASISGQNFVSWATENGTHYRESHTQPNIKGAFDTLSADMIKETDPDRNNGLAQALMAYSNSSASLYTYNLYFQKTNNIDFEGRILTAEEIAQNFSSDPDLTFNVLSTASGSGQDVYPFDGFYSDKTKVTRIYSDNAGDDVKGGTINFYYTRRSYWLIYDNKGVKQKEKRQYGTSLTDVKDIVPEYPTALPENAYKFSGWYTSESFAAGTEFSFDTVMPADDLLLYAKWSKITHDVTVQYRDDTTPSKTFHPVHGTSIINREEGDQPIEMPEREGYTFLGWFYINAIGEKIAFDFENTEVNRDLTVFADWRANRLADYKINFLSEDGQTVAPPTTGRGFVGMTKTLFAKFGKQLSGYYQTGYFPQRGSQSIIVGETTEINFLYVRREAVPYTVKYLNAQTLQPLETEKTVENNTYAVVDETFLPISGYVPDKFQKRLFLSADEDAVNELTFYYSEDHANAPFVERHILHNADGTKTDYATIEGLAKIGSTHTAAALSIHGYHLKEPLPSGTVPPEGLSLEVHYSPDSCQYTVRYLEYGTNTELQPPKIVGEIPYGASCTETAPVITGYELASTSATTTITIALASDSNIITFYYRVPQTIIKYTALIPDGFGSSCGLDRTQEIPGTSASVLGAAPLLMDDTCYFKGWFLDKNGTTAVNSDWVSGNRLTPPKATAEYFAVFAAKPTYTVRHFWQNADGTYPTVPGQTDTLRGMPGAQTAAAAKTGYDTAIYQNAPLAFSQTAIAEDGSTVIDIFYPRNTCTVHYALNGGTGIYPDVSVPYGGSHQTAAAPTRSQYRFDGWKDGTSIYQPDSTLIITANITLTAVWTKKDSPSAPSKPTRPTLTLESNGGTEYPDESYRIGTVVPLDRVPSRDGFTFTGWYKDPDCTEAITEVIMNRDRTVYAGWQLTPVPAVLNDSDHFAYVVGYPDGTVRPRANVTRAETASIFFRLLEPELRDRSLTQENPFTDVTPNSWYSTPVSTMYALGILNGRSGTVFDPNAPITRAELASICARFDTSAAAGVPCFTDLEGCWAKADIERAAALGWVRGCAAGTFCPNQPITRAEAVTIINRVLGRLPQQSADLLDGMRIWPDNPESAWYYLPMQEATNSHDFVTRDTVYERWIRLTPDPDWQRYAQ